MDGAQRPELNAWSDRARAFRVTVEPGVEEPYVALAPCFPGITGCGDTPDEAIAVAYAGLADALETFALEGREAPQPLGQFNGQLTVRLPRTLQRLLTERAESEGVSVNATVTMLLTEALGAGGVVKAPRRGRAA